MKTNYSKICTRKNTAMLLVGFLTPVVLFTSLTVSMFNSGDSKAAVKTTQKYAGEKDRKHRLGLRTVQPQRILSDRGL